MESDMNHVQDSPDLPKRPWRPGIDPLEADEELVPDMGAYHMLHHAMLEWSCLSFDILPDSLGYERRNFPHTAYVVTGTQADKTNQNQVFVMKWQNLVSTEADKDTSDSESEEDENKRSEQSQTEGNGDITGTQPKLCFRSFPHPGTVNRIRCCQQAPRLIATWADTGHVHIWDVEACRKQLDEPADATQISSQPLFTFSGHKTEGYAIDWNPHVVGQLVTGDCNNVIQLWKPIEGGWSVGNQAFKEHTGSVEDLQWKRIGEGIGEIFASVSVDRSIRIFDCRSPNAKSIQVIEQAHESDINVLSWNPIQGHLILTGADDGVCKVWDSRLSDFPVSKFAWHQKPITSVDWHPTDEATFACSSYDNSTSMWDLSVEACQDEKTKEVGDELPGQLMFHHLGQELISEIKWHPQIPGVIITTALDGFNIFKASNI